jgi:hypothetical protein
MASLFLFFLHVLTSMLGSLLLASTLLVAALTHCKVFNLFFSSIMVNSLFHPRWWHKRLALCFHCIVHLSWLLSFIFLFNYFLYVSAMVIFLSHVALGFQPLAFAFLHCFLFLTPVFLLFDFSFYIMHFISHIAQFSNHTYFFLLCFFLFFYVPQVIFSFLFWFSMSLMCASFFFFVVSLFFFCNYLSTCLYFLCPYFSAYFFFLSIWGFSWISCPYFYITPISTSQLLLLEPSFCVAFTSQLLFLTYIALFFLNFLCYLNLCIFLKKLFVWCVQVFLFVYICKCWCGCKSFASYIFKYW